MEWILRRAREGDGEQIARLNREDLGYDFPEDETEKMLTALIKSPRDVVFVAERDNELLGYVHGCDYDSLYMLPLKDVRGIAVSASSRGMGVGKSLLLALEEWAQHDGATGIRLVSGIHRTGAHTFYKCCGYTAGDGKMNFIKWF